MNLNGKKCIQWTIIHTREVNGAITSSKMKKGSKDCRKGKIKNLFNQMEEVLSFNMKEKVDLPK
jgi:hypothetical protein